MFHDLNISVKTLKTLLDMYREIEKLNFHLNLFNTLFSTLHFTIYYLVYCNLNH